MSAASWTRRGLFGLLGALRSVAAEDFGHFLERIVDPVQGTLGFAIRHIETGSSVSIRGSERFAMASVYKLPIAAAVLDAVDKGELAFEKIIRLTPADLRLGLGNRDVEGLVGQSSHAFTVGELLERTLIDSDNASGDALLRLITSRRVTELMASFGVPEIRVDREERDILLDFVGVPKIPPTGGWTLNLLVERYSSADEAQRRQAMAAFLHDPRDTATPDSMVQLLVSIHRREMLSPDSGERLISLMARCETGARRLRGDLPPETVFLHRTGTTDSTAGVTLGTNDVGILTLPGGRGHVAIAAFLRTAKGSMAEREQVLAHIGRAVYERYVGA